MSPKGNFELASYIFECLGTEFTLGKLVLTGSVATIGDLGSKFSPPISENIDYFEIADELSKPVVTFDNSSDFLPERHIGITIQLTNSNAPMRKSLRIFGNSFLGVASEYSSLWLLGLAFEKVSFHWSPRVLPEHIEEGEIVIFQTCERFLGYPPNHGG